ncbi:MAG TPA: ATP-binding protein [Rhizomicrobium sp.]|jgi:two-component system osmolarity sensor histidine kinase EnvZ|nr:ATP-binding protein [Rhizomicrobium sp.]
MARFEFHPFQTVKRFLPRGLFWRSLIIIVMPVVILQGIVSYVFFERDLDITTQRMAIDVAADVALLTAIENKYPPVQRAQMRALAARQLRYDVTFLPGAQLVPPTRRHRFVSSIDEALDSVIAEQLGGTRHFETRRRGSTFHIGVEVNGGVLRIIVPRERVTVSSPDIFILWMVGSSVVLVGIAILFLRNQVRPIERLAIAAESFGKGRAVPDFKPYGASEVRSAARAFLTMRERIERFVQQRTDMLAGVSHDLKTPLTRIKLQLAMMPDSADTAALRIDIFEMEKMLDEYLQFARGEGGEEAVNADLGYLVREAADAAARARRGEGRIAVATPEHLMLTVKRNALRRCITNLVDNALKHGKRVAVSVERDEHAVDILVDDDGPGIPESRREEAFRPFHRLDEGRNLQTGGVGLGLAIARDIARAHGGDLTLHDSPSGGLRAMLRLPV